MPLSLRITAGVRITAAVVGIATLLGPRASAADRAGPDDDLPG